jgi:hypothetical protein
MRCGEEHRYGGNGWDQNPSTHRSIGAVRLSKISEVQSDHGVLLDQPTWEGRAAVPRLSDTPSRTRVFE